MRLLFLGSPAAAVPTLQALLDSPHEVVAVVTQPDRPAGRGQKLTPCPVAQLARQEKIQLLQPERAKDPAAIAAIQALAVNLAIVVAYGQILPRAILEAPKHGCWNIHFSLLPRYRGAAPVAWALIHSETQTGVSLIRLIEKLDAGPILRQSAVAIRLEDNRESLEMRLAERGAQLCLEGLADLAAGRLKETPQDEAQASYAPLLKKADGAIDWTADAAAIAARIRGLDPWPGAYTSLPATGPRVDKVWVKIYSAEIGATDASAPAGTVVTADPAEGLVIACGRGTLKIREVQAAGKKRMGAAEFLRGHKITAGTRLSS